MAEEADTDALVRDAERLPWAERLTHAHWRVRAEAYAAVTTAAAGGADTSVSPLSDFGAASMRCVPSCTFPRALGVPHARCVGTVCNKAAGDTNANALDAGLEALVAFLTRADEEFAARCVAQPAMPPSQLLT